MSPRAQGDFAAGCAMLTAFGAAFLVMGLVPMRLFWYHPLEHRWLLEMRPQGLAMDFYGRTLYASMAAVVAALVARALATRVAQPSRDRLWLWLSYGLVFVFLAMALMGYQLWPRPALPLPIPAWYQAK